MSVVCCQSSVVKTIDNPEAACAQPVNRQLTTDNPEAACAQPDNRQLTTDNPLAQGDNRRQTTNNYFPPNIFLPNHRNGSK
jgi:hypothetical protein